MLIMDVTVLTQELNVYILSTIMSFALASACWVSRIICSKRNTEDLAMYAVCTFCFILVLAALFIPYSVLSSGFVDATHPVIVPFKILTAVCCGYCYIQYGYFFGYSFAIRQVFSGEKPNQTVIGHEVLIRRLLKALGWYNYFGMMLLLGLSSVLLIAPTLTRF